MIASFIPPGSRRDIFLFACMIKSAGVIVVFVLKIRPGRVSILFNLPHLDLFLTLIFLNSDDDIRDQHHVSRDCRQCTRP